MSDITKLDIKTFVTGHRLAYRDNYMQHTLGFRVGTEDRFAAHHPDDTAEIKFENCEICVSCVDRSHPHLWAVNNIQELTAGRKRAMIIITEDLLQLPKTRRKFILAKEWIEVMLGFANIEVRKREQRLGNGDEKRVVLIELFNSLGIANHWEEDKEEEKILQLGLQHLLLSKETFKGFLAANFNGMRIRQLQDLANDPGRGTEAYKLLGSLERSLAAAKSIPRSLVELRLQQLLFG